MSEESPSYQNAVVIWEELCTKYHKFWFSDPTLKASGYYSFGFTKGTSPSCYNSHAVGTISVGEDLGITLTEIPLAEVKVDLSTGHWSWALADPRSIDELFNVMDSIYEAFHQYREGQALQLGNHIEIDDMLDKEQTIKKLMMAASEVLGVPYQRKFINELRDKLQDPEFNKASGPDDWRVYIIDEVRENWHFLDELARLLFWMNATEHLKK